MDSLDLNCHLTDIANLQNAIVRQRGCPCDHLCLQYVVPNILSITIVAIASDHLHNHFLDQLTFDGLILEKARFLLSIVPTLTVTDSIGLLCHDTKLPFKDEIANISNSHHVSIRRKSTQQLNAALAAILRNYPN